MTSSTLLGHLLSNCHIWFRKCERDMIPNLYRPFRDDSWSDTVRPSRDIVVPSGSAWSRDAVVGRMRSDVVWMGPVAHTAQSVPSLRGQPQALLAKHQWWIASGLRCYMDQGFERCSRRRLRSLNTLPTLCKVKNEEISATARE